MLEYLSIFVIEVTSLHIDMQNYAMQQKNGLLLKCKVNPFSQFGPLARQNKKV